MDRKTRNRLSNLARKATKLNGSTAMNAKFSKAWVRRSCVALLRCAFVPVNRMVTHEDKHLEGLHLSEIAKKHGVQLTSELEKDLRAWKVSVSRWCVVVSFAQFRRSI